MGSPLISSSWLRMHQITSVTYIHFRRDTRVKMTARMPPIEKTDYPALDMGHSFSRTDISIVGLEVQVYGLEEIKGSSKPIVGLVRFPLSPFIPMSPFSSNSVCYLDCGVYCVIEPNDRSQHMADWVQRKTWPPSHQVS